MQPNVRQISWAVMSLSGTGHGAMSDLSLLCAQKRTLTKTRFSQDLPAKRDSKLTYLTARIASFVRVPCL
jgi:hypothetical protein